MQPPLASGSTGAEGSRRAVQRQTRKQARMHLFAGPSGDGVQTGHSIESNGHRFLIRSRRGCYPTPDHPGTESRQVIPSRATDGEARPSRRVQRRFRRVQAHPLRPGTERLTSTRKASLLRVCTHRRCMFAYSRHPFLNTRAHLHRLSTRRYRARQRRRSRGALSPRGLSSAWRSSGQGPMQA